MDSTAVTQYIVFDGDRRMGAGGLIEVARAAKRCLDLGMPGPLLLFDAVTSQPLELDLRGSLDELLARLTVVLADPAPPTNGSGPASTSLPDVVRPGPGRPRLGVVAREITLLPRHWEWLSEQRGGASVTFDGWWRKRGTRARKAIVDVARRSPHTASCRQCLATNQGLKKRREHFLRAMQKSLMSVRVSGRRICANMQCSWRGQCSMCDSMSRSSTRGASCRT